MTTIPPNKCVFCRWTSGNYKYTQPFLFDGDVCGFCGIDAEKEREVHEFYVERKWRVGGEA